MSQHEIVSIINDSPAPNLESEPEIIAEQLIFLMHRGVDWNVWGGDRRYRYWDAFTDRIRAATYSGATLQDWWDSLCKQIKSQPRNAADRAFVVMLLSQNPRDEKLILAALRKHASVLVMRLRVHVEFHKKNTVKASK